MRKPVVFCTENEYIVSPKVEAYLREHVEFIRAEKKLTPEELRERIGDADGLISMGYPIDDRLLDRAPKLRVVSTTSAGFDPFNLEDMKKHNVIGLHTPAVLNNSVADMILLLMLAVARRAVEMDKVVRDGKWPVTPFYEFFGSEVSGKRVGIIGMGNIGEGVAKRCKNGFDMDVVYYNRHRKLSTEEKLGVEYVTMDELLATSDFVVIMVPLDDTTRHMMDAGKFAKMKKSAFFINASRGPVVDEPALIAALRDGTIAGAGLDVFDVEPIGADNELCTFPNTVLLPHVASATRECREAMGQLAAKGIVEFFEGKEPANTIKFFKK